MGLIIIIGAGSGIRQAVAKRFGKEGFEIGLIARTEAKLKELVAQLKSEGITAYYAVGNVADENSLKLALRIINDKAGHASMILYNAVSVVNKDILEQDWETIKNSLDINVGGYFNLMKSVLPFCIENNLGKLFVTGGGFALQGDDQWTALSVGKAALRNMVQAFQKRVNGSNVHIAQLTVAGYVAPDDKRYNTESIAEEFWKLFNQKQGEFESEVIY